MLFEIVTEIAKGVALDKMPMAPTATGVRMPDPQFIWDKDEGKVKSKEKDIKDLFIMY